VVAVVALATTPALAQRQGGRGRGGFAPSPLMLLTQKPVQEDLKLSEDQVKKIQELQKSQPQQGRLGGFQKLSQEERDELRKKMEALAAANKKAIAEILTPDQVKRVDQITLQARGAGAFADAKVAEALNLTEEQKEKIKALQDDFQSAAGELR